VLSDAAQAILKNLSSMIIPDFLNKRKETSVASPYLKRNSERLSTMPVGGRFKASIEEFKAGSLEQFSGGRSNTEAASNKNLAGQTLKRSGSTEEKNKSKEKFIMFPIAASYHGTPKEVSVCEDLDEDEEEDKRNNIGNIGKPIIQGSIEEVIQASTLKLLATETSTDEQNFKSFGSPAFSLKTETALNEKEANNAHSAQEEYGMAENMKSNLLSKNSRKEKGLNDSSKLNDSSSESFSSESAQKVGSRSVKNSFRKGFSIKPEFVKSKTHALANKQKSGSKNHQPDQEGDSNSASPSKKGKLSGDLKISISHIKTNQSLKDSARGAKSKLRVETKSTGRKLGQESERSDLYKGEVGTLVESQVISEEGETQIFKSKADINPPKISKTLSLKNESLIIQNKKKLAKKKGSTMNLNSDLSEAPTSSDQIEEESPYTIVSSESRESPLSGKVKLMKKTKALMKVSRIVAKIPGKGESSLRASTIDNITEEGLISHDLEGLHRKSYLSEKLDRIDEHSLDEGFDLRQKLIESGKLSRNENAERDEVEELLANPLELLNEVINEASIDQETKLDLYLYGSRKQALNDYIKEMESNLEMNILSQKSCKDQLASFFDVSLTKLLKPKDLTFYNQLMAPYVRNKWKRNTDYGFADDELRFDSNGRLLAGSSDELLRKQEFLKQKEIVNQLKILDRKTLPEVSQQTVLTLDINKRQILLGEKIIETLILRGNTLLNITETSKETSNGIPNGKNPFLSKLKKLKEILLRLKKEKPQEFLELIESFEETKLRYDESLKESDPLKFLF